MEQVEEVEPVQFHQLYGCASYGVIAVAAFAPGDVLVAEHFAGSVAKPVARVTSSTRPWRTPKMAAARWPLQNISAPVG